METDPNKLVKFCCGLNIMKNGEEVPLKDNSEYPEWLWTLKTDGGPSLEEMDPDTIEYWYRKRNLALRFKHKMMKDKYPEPFIPKEYKNLRLP